MIELYIFSLSLKVLLQINLIFGNGECIHNVIYPHCDTIN